MKILITGGEGFIGCHLGNYLSSRGHLVSGLDDRSSPSKQEPQFSCYFADVSMIWHYVEHIKPDAVIHLAAKVNVDESLLKPDAYLKTNILGTQAVIEACLRYNVGLIYASTSEVYGNPDHIPIREEDSTRCESVYAVSKLAGEKLVGVAHQTRGLKSVRLRVFNTYGPYQREKPYGAMIPIFTGQALRGEPITVFGSGSQERDYIHVRDVCRAYEMALGWLDQDMADPVNIGTGESWSAHWFAYYICVLLGRSPSRTIKSVDARPGEIRCLRADTRMAQQLGFQAQIALPDGLKEYVEWRKAQDAHIQNSD